MGDQVRTSGSALELPGGVTVRFMRTLRLPETGTHPMPPGLGTFPLRAVADHPDRAPAEWLARGGVMLPVYRREAMWLSFSATAPAALQVGVGRLCAVSGRPWSDRLSPDPQNYVVLPRQPWLDGITSGSGTIRQFVAGPPADGADRADGSTDGTVDGRLPDEEDWAGVRLQVFELGEKPLAAWRAEQRRRSVRHQSPWGVAGDETAPGAIPLAPAAVTAPPVPAPRPVPATGVATGGRMRQDVYRDDRPPGDWREHASGQVFVHLATAPQWRHITGEAPPASPVDRAAYTAANLPWLGSYDSDADDLAEAGPEPDANAGDAFGDGGGRGAYGDH